MHMVADICHPPADWSCRWTEAELAEQDPDQIEIAEAFAWSLLASLTLYRIGTCPIVVRPCAQRCLPAGTYRTAIARGGNTAALPVAQVGMLNPYITGGAWTNGCGCRPGGCSCSALSEVILPGPVGSIVEVWLDGQQLPSTAYRVFNGNRLIRTDGEDWPACQDMTASDHDGFSVTYYRGVKPNSMTMRAAGVLANEFLLACAGDDSCRLPYNVTSAVRSGESYDFQQTDFVDGNTGIPEVQALLRIYNPNMLKSPVIVASPDDYLVATPTWR